MIFTDFATNEKFVDTLTALKISFKPWKWIIGNETTKLKLRLKQKKFTIFRISGKQSQKIIRSSALKVRSGSQLNAGLRG